MWLIEQHNWDQSSIPIRWCRTRDDADRWLMEHPPEKDEPGLSLVEMLDDGSFDDGEREWFEYVPDRYYGPTVTAKVVLCPDAGDSMRCVHRMPIDCIQACPDAELTVDWPYRILEAHTRSAICNCQGWQLVEGSPEKIAELVAEYPYEETLP